MAVDYTEVPMGTVDEAEQETGVGRENFLSMDSELYVPS